ncbi:Cytosolic Fe-S cluster assembly factor nubp1 [Liparis tanakae]|uniref:Cytosolic Fe-S cluster assembly factor nubp1 n=1 Tax=Liparis tanakae TaxID=230148 RepID=A0A4Z2F1C7_9TELE|nr:Cytosolic Fe-S cluster assembly factor nubp1 [Liparis tanakae]
MCADLDLRLLGKVPLDPRIARSCDEGKSFLAEVPDSPATRVYQSIVQSIQDYCSKRATEEQSDT